MANANNVRDFVVNSLQQVYESLKLNVQNYKCTLSGQPSQYANPKAGDIEEFTEVVFAEDVTDGNTYDYYGHEGLYLKIKDNCRLYTDDFGTATIIVDDTSYTIKGFLGGLSVYDANNNYVYPTENDLSCWLIPLTFHYSFPNVRVIDNSTEENKSSILGEYFAAISIVYPSKTLQYDGNNWIELKEIIQKQADWNETNSSSYSYILNKPYIENIYFSEPESTAGSSSSATTSTYLSTKWDVTIPQLDDIKDGTSILIRIPENNGALRAGAVISVNGGDYHPVTYNITTPIGTRIPISYTTLVTYNSSASAVTYLTAGTKTTVTGVWQTPYDYNTNTDTIGCSIRLSTGTMPASDTSRYYKIFFTSADGTHWVPASANSTSNATSARAVNQRPIDPFGTIVYSSASTNYPAETNVTASSLWEQYELTLGYSFNRTGAALTLTSWKPVYVKCAPQSNGSAIIDADTPYVQDLPITEDGKIYIFLGIATSATKIELNINHPVYYYKDGAIRLWTNQKTASVVWENGKNSSNIAYTGSAQVIGSGSFAYANYSVAEGKNTLACGDRSHTEGSNAVTYGLSSHAEGSNTTSVGAFSHAEGNGTYTLGDSSHVEGKYTYAYNAAEHAEGQYNKSTKTSDTFGNAGNTIHSIGIGIADNNRKNAFEIMQNGNAYLINIGNYIGNNLSSAQPLQTVISSLSSTMNVSRMPSLSDNGTMMFTVYDTFGSSAADFEKVYKGQIKAFAYKNGNECTTATVLSSYCTNSGVASVDDYVIIQFADHSIYKISNEWEEYQGGGNEPAPVPDGDGWIKCKIEKLYPAQADWNEDDPTEYSYILNKPNAHDVKILYAASEEDELTSEQKTHNLAVLDELMTGDNLLNLNINVPVDLQLDMGEYLGTWDLHCQLYSCIKDENDVYHLVLNIPLWLFGFENGICLTSTTDGNISINFQSFMKIDTNYKVNLGNDPLSNTEKTEQTLNGITADFSLVSTTPSTSNLPKYLDAIDADILTFDVKGNRSYGYHVISGEELNYYEFWYNTEDKRVRIRVYSDDSVTTYWEYIDQATNILSIIEEDEEVISTAVNELNSYVHSSYAYILQTIEDNEFVIASTLTEHDERLIEVENALENVNYEETDPTVPNYIKNITQSNINTWNTVSNCVTKTQLTNQSYVTSSILNTRLSNSSYAGYSYVYAAYSYIIDSMVSNERIIAAGFANHENRITILEASGGEDNVQSNWNETDSTSDAYILNKPEIPSITGLATETYVLDKISGLVNSAPVTLDTLNELAAALGNDPNFATTVSTQIGERVTKTELSNQSYVTETSLQSRGYLTSFTETDPVFTASPAHSITGTDITNWNNKVSNVQANWNTTNSSDQSYILNKPELVWEKGDGTNSAVLSGGGSRAFGDNSVAEGSMSYTGVIRPDNVSGLIGWNDGDFAHAEGSITYAFGQGSHSEGMSTLAYGNYSHAEGTHTTAYNEAEYAGGFYNKSIKSNTVSEATLHTIGIGTSDNLKNAFAVMKNGNAYFINVGNYNGTNLTSSTPLHTVLNEKVTKTELTGLGYVTQATLSAQSYLTSETKANWNETNSSSAAYIQNKPTIPAAANNATITIQKGGTNIDSFTVNASSNKSINIPNELPSYSSSDAGKILSVNSSGQLVWITPASIYTGSGTPSNSTGNDGDIYLQS